MNRFFLFAAFLAFTAVPVVIGSAESKNPEPKNADAGTEKKTEAKNEGKKSDEKNSNQVADGKTNSKVDTKADAAVAAGESEKSAHADKKDGKDSAEHHTSETTRKVNEHRRQGSECLASEEVIQDLEGREKKLKEREEALGEKEKSLSAQEAAIKEELTKLEKARDEVQGIRAKSLADREEKVNKLMETLETMSPKTASAVINGVDDELAVTVLARLTNVKAGKILANLTPEKSSRLSELMAYGRVMSNGKEKVHGESSERAPATKH